MRILFWLLLCLTLLPPVISAQSNTDAEAQPAAAVSEPDSDKDTDQNNDMPAADTPPAALRAPAKADNGTARPTGGLGLGKMALSLAIVVAVVLALGWIFKKLTLRLPGSRHIKIISTMPLGPKERLLVIEIQGKQRVLGVTAHSINLLFELENSLPEEKLASDFHTQLQSFLKK